MERHVPAAKKAKLLTPTFVTMGEAMIRFQPIDKSLPVSTTRHLPQPFLRSIGGDELNVAVALSLTGVKSRWISVVPTGPMGDIITDSCVHHGVEFAGQRVDGDIGTFTVLPEAKTVHYQRRHSVWALHEPESIAWAPLLQDGTASPWLHVTGITPLISDPSRQSWCNVVAAAAKAAIPTSLDLNHRKQLGTLATLWSIVAPHAAIFEASALVRTDVGRHRLPAHHLTACLFLVIALHVI